MEKVIEINNLTKKYAKSNINAVDNISFDVGGGEFFAFLGPNGAGKTTTISILTTTLSKTKGTVKIAGYDLDTETKKVRENIGIIFQSHSLDIDLSAEQNIRFHACLYGMYVFKPSFKMMNKEYKAKVLELAKIVGIEECLFKKVSKLSGGQKRKLEIIRSLIHTPKVLFLDEPTQGLDANSRRALWKYIDSVRKKYNTTIFLTTHYIDEAELADRVCIINKGKIAKLDTPENLKKELLRPELIIDSEDRNGLERELKEKNLEYKIDRHIIVNCLGLSFQDVILSIKTKLNFLNTHEPSLEDAYIEFLNIKEDKQ